MDVCENNRDTSSQDSRRTSVLLLTLTFNWAGTSLLWSPTSNPHPWGNTVSSRAGKAWLACATTGAKILLKIYLGYGPNVALPCLPCHGNQTWIWENNGGSSLTVPTTMSIAISWFHWGILIGFESSELCEHLGATTLVVCMWPVTGVKWRAALTLRETVTHTNTGALLYHVAISLLRLCNCCEL